MDLPAANLRGSQARLDFRRAVLACPPEPAGRMSPYAPLIAFPLVGARSDARNAARRPEAAGAGDARITDASATPGEGTT